MIPTKATKILQHLRSNARASLAKISTKTNLPISTAHDHLKRMEKNIIIKHSPLLDFTGLGYPYKVQVLLKVNQKQRNELETHLTNHNSVNNLYKVNHNHDLLAEAVFQNAQKLDDFITQLQQKFQIKDLNTIHIVKDIEREKFVPEVKENG